MSNNLTERFNKIRQMKPERPNPQRFERDFHAHAQQAGMLAAHFSTVLEKKGADTACGQMQSMATDARFPDGMVERAMDIFAKHHRALLRPGN